MLQDIKSLQEEIGSIIDKLDSQEKLDAFRLEYLVKKGKIQALFDRMKEVPKEDKPLVGKELNVLRKGTEAKYKEIEESFTKTKKSSPTLDLTLPGRRSTKGTVHPVLQTMNEMVKIFQDLGFAVAEGPEIETEFYNFDALNFPPNHPARDLQDTFFIDSDGDDRLLLRTHTSPVQIRVMQNLEPPIRCIMPGRVYRNESINARSLAEFHQIEGLYIDKNVSLADLKSTLITFARKIYGEDSKFRFRPHFFPFTEPSAELDISCFLCKGEGCRVCKYTGWLEILGCGMVHPNVLRAGGIDPEVYSGYAFGCGIERITMLRTGINDIRFFYDNDVRVLGQF